MAKETKMTYGEIINHIEAGDYQSRRNPNYDRNAPKTSPKRKRSFPPKRHIYGDLALYTQAQVPGLPERVLEELVLHATEENDDLRNQLEDVETFIHWLKEARESAPA
jgi:hypothetical protein